MNTMTEHWPAAVDNREHTKIISWRVHELLRAGYDDDAASRLAVADVDLHRACELLQHGCSQELALQILL